MARRVTPRDGKMKYLVDSNILIYHLNGEEIATNFLIENFENIAISQINYIEVLSFPFENDSELLVRELLESFEVIDIDINISKQAIKNRKLFKIKLADNIIASTAMLYNLILVTRNIKDFKNLNISLLNPFDI